MNRLISTSISIVCLSALLLICPVTASAEDAKTTSAVSPQVDAQTIQATRKKGLDFLRNSQASDGSWTTNRTLGITALALVAASRNGVKAEDPMLAKGLEFLTKSIQKDGGVYAPKSEFRTYETSLAILALREANTNGKYDKVIADAVKFLKADQWGEAQGLKPSDINFGGAGYGGGKSRPDLSNTQFLIDALRTAGVPADDPSLQNALKFVSRCQNLESQANTTEFAAKSEDGGFYYTPAAGGKSPAGKTPKGGLRSYGTMTYAGLKSMIYCDVKQDDPRVKAALGWIRRHYSVSENPGVGKEGLFYYYHTFAKSLHALGQDIIEDQDGVRHNWRNDLAARLVADQKANGSWINTVPRWFEGDPNLVTAYSLLALSYCESPKAESAKPDSAK